MARPSPRPKPEMLRPPPQNLGRLLTSQVRHIEGKAFQVGVTVKMDRSMAPCDLFVCLVIFPRPSVTPALCRDKIAAIWFV